MTKGLIFLILSFLLNGVVAQVQSEHAHREHLHEVEVDGEEIALDASKFDEFSSGLSDCQIAVISVNGMVCDFCARGIEKIFLKDKHVKKISVDLSQGKVLVAYSQNKKISLADVTQKILANGQNVTDLEILNIN